MNSKLIGALIVIITVILLGLTLISNTVLGTPIEAYRVLVDGKEIGYVESRDEVYDLIDKEQSDLKDKYGVSKVYPPESLSIQKVYTYENKLVSAQEIYDAIKDNEHFTIEGYVLSIKSSGEVLDNSDDENVDENTNTDTTTTELYVLDKSFVKDALHDTAAAFIGSEELQKFEDDMQEEIVDTGEIITSVYLDETITVRKDYISTDQLILMNEAELAEYLLYGKLDSYKQYTIKDGESLETIADEYYLSLQELLLANPDFEDGTVLLAVGDVINIAEVDPLVHFVYHKTNVEDLKVNYKTVYETDSSKYTTYQETTTKGVNGVYRATQDVKYINGEIANITVLKKETLVETVNEVITKGTKKTYSGGGKIQYSSTLDNSEWSWPTVSPFKIVSGFKMRTLYNQTKMHQGIDIILSGATTYGSPIYAVKDGVVVHVNYDKSKNEGQAVWILHDGDIYTQYMHMSKILVKVGDKVSREQKIGLIGCTGKCYGAHLHLGVWYGYPYRDGVAKDPCKTIFKC